MHASSLTPPASPRLNTIDFMRGLVIVIMALDHTRDLLHTTSLSQSPVDIATTTPGLFMTRWITHFCAPVFVFLAGASAYLMMKSRNDPPATRRFLFSRGLWLIFLEITVVGFGIWSDIQFRTFLFQVIFAIGSGFILLSLLSRLPSRLAGGLGLLIILCHNLLPAEPFDHSGHGGGGSLIWGLLFHGGVFKLSADHALIIGYPAIPWLGVMLLGFGFGEVFTVTPERRKRVLLLCGAGALLIFIVLRGFNLYGDPRPWSLQSSGIFSLLSFLNVNKYPPSLMYVCVTLSVMFFVLCLAESQVGKGLNNRFMSFFITYGRVPMFFYLLHWYIVHSSMFVMLILQGVAWEQMPFGIMQFGRPEQGVGLELPFVYLYWFCLVLVMYPLCRWYGRYKAAHKENKWLAYL
jgi:uncharacterized membrane protein